MSHNDEEHIKVLEDQVEEGMAQVVQPEKDHFPLCIVWTPLPLLTWFVPFIGHVGITTSRGTIHDFAGSHYVNVRIFSLLIYCNEAAGRPQSGNYTI
jgi:hypothetical protein